MAHMQIRLGPPQRMTVKPPPIMVNGRRLIQGRPLVIPPLHSPLWFANGWRKAAGKNEFTGHYSVAGRRWRGLIKDGNGRAYTAFIWNPPMAQIERNTIHSVCFSSSLRDDSITDTKACYRVHYEVNPGSLDHAIVSIELVLAEALNVTV